jgi:hypothetical protein
MNSILMKGVIRNGRVEVEEPINLPDGSEVVVQWQNGDAGSEGEVGWDNSPEGIAAWLKWCDALRPLTITPREEADAEAWLKKISEHDRANMDKTIEGLFP